jgi:hypothetical protein
MPGLDREAAGAGGGGLSDGALDGRGGGSSDAADSGGSGGGGGASVLQHHKNPNRDGHYVDSAITKAAAANLHVDPTFQGNINGPTYAQPLYFERGPGGKDVILVATEQNDVFALSAADGSVVWQKRLAASIARATLPCGDLDPLGVTGTPVIDAASRTMFVAAMTSPDSGVTKKHLIFAVSIDDGTTRAGWPLDVSATVTAGSTKFDSSVHNQRSALALVNGTLYITYGGHAGDCADYRGWVVSVPIANPSGAKGFATFARGGGIWGPSGPSSDGTSVFVATGNTIGVTAWSFGEALLRFEGGATFSGLTKDYFVPSNWKAMDDADLDLGGTSPLVLDLPTATQPLKLLVALGKNGVIYLVDRQNMGGFGRGNGTVGEAIFSARVTTNAIINAAASYTTARGTYVVFKGIGIGCPDGGAGDLTAVQLSPGPPIRASVAWCAFQNGLGSPIATTTDGRSEAIVWGLGAEGSSRMYGYDGDTGRVIFAGGGPQEAISSLHRYVTPIVANGRIFVAADSRVYAFTTR